MKYKITKPRDTDEPPTWIPEMDEYCNATVNIDNSDIYATYSGHKFVDIGEWSFNMKWLKPTHNKVLNHDD